MPRPVSSYRIHRYQQRRDKCCEINAICSDNEDAILSPRQTPRPLLHISNIVTPLDDTTNVYLVESVTDSDIDIDIDIDGVSITKNDKWGITHLVNQILSYVLD